MPQLSRLSQNLSLTDAYSLAACFGTPTIAWLFVKPYIILAQQVTPIRKQLIGFKRNNHLFEKMLAEQKSYKLPNEEDTLIIGNKEAESVITMISNPYCIPCSKAHRSLDEILANKDNVKLQIIFTVDDELQRDTRSKVVRHMLSLRNEQDSASLKKALSDWYGQEKKDFNAWSNTYPVTEAQGAKELLDAHINWCRSAEIYNTPTILVNGYLLPPQYQAEDIKYFI
jgi:thiol-disulfide isomerase/thioredoxin